MLLIHQQYEEKSNLSYAWKKRKKKKITPEVFDYLTPKNHDGPWTSSSDIFQLG